MTSLKQIEANRRNALRSTGPKTVSGKQRASQNAVRHGLTAETVIGLLEDSEDYRAFEMAVTANYDAITAVERELVLRLASLLWRLRRATSIETGLLEIHAGVLHEETPQQENFHPSEETGARTGCYLRAVEAPQDRQGSDHGNTHTAFSAELADVQSIATPGPDTKCDVAHCFLHLTEIDKGAFERVNRYETALWRQARQTIMLLESLRWRSRPHAKTRPWQSGNW